MNFAVPSLLSATHNWGAFLFFASWCLLAIVYVFFLVPETSGLSVEEIDILFKGPWLNTYRRGDALAKGVPEIEQIEHAA